jgi:branched-chain amino acid transport system ATP-binding protein
MSLLEVRGLEVTVGGVQILRGIDLDIRAGALVSIVGANGAGKTTLLRTLSRLVPASRGEILFDGNSLAAQDAFRVTRSGLVHVPQGRMIIPTLSVEDNLRIGAGSLPGMVEAEMQRRLAVEFGRFPVLKDRRRIAGGALSGGEQQMLAVSRALMMQPRLLLLDEPSLGLAPQIVSTIFSTLRTLTAAGMTVLLVEQAAIMALRIADHGYVLQNGRIVLSGVPADLLKDPALVSRYLG